MASNAETVSIWWRHHDFCSEWSYLGIWNRCIIGFVRILCDRLRCITDLCTWFALCCVWLWFAIDQFCPNPQGSYDCPSTMMTSSNGNILRHWPFVRGIHRSPLNSPHKGQWRGALMFSLISAWTNGSVNNRDAGDLRRHRAHYDVTVMTSEKLWIIWVNAKPQQMSQKASIFCTFTTAFCAIFIDNN